MMFAEVAGRNTQKSKVINGRVLKFEIKSKVQSVSCRVPSILGILPKSTLRLEVSSLYALDTIIHC